MSDFADVDAAVDAGASPTAYAAALSRWLHQHPGALDGATVAQPTIDGRLAGMRRLMASLHEAGWSRVGWPEAAGGLGGTILHRAAMWEVLARHGVTGMAAYEHLEILAPVLVQLGPPAFVAEVLPTFLAGRELWAQGFSEPGAGSDLASLRTTARATDGGFVVDGRKIWTSWAASATWCLLLARTGTADSRHRGLTALVVDLRAPGIEVTPIVQANGTAELAEVAFDGVHVPADRVVGEVDGGWAVAMRILSHERGTFAWFRHGFLHQQLRSGLDLALAAHDRALGDALLDLATVTATSHDGLETHATGQPLGPRAAYPKLLLCAAEQSVHDWLLAVDADIAVDPFDDHVAVRRQEYLFSRIVTIYGGSQQMQLETIAKHNLRLP